MAMYWEEIAVNNIMSAAVSLSQKRKRFCVFTQLHGIIRSDQRIILAEQLGVERGEILLVASRLSQDCRRPFPRPSEIDSMHYYLGLLGPHELETLSSII